MTRVFVMGAVGAMCIEATRDLIETSGFDEFLLADLNEEKLRKLDKELNDKRIHILNIDASDSDRVSEAISGYDFVMNGLPFGMAEPTVHACIKRKIPTILLDDFLEEKCSDGYEKAGVLCCAGVGMTPGVTDLLARYAVDQCDKVDEIHISWGSFRPIALSPGLILTTFWEMDPDEEVRAYYEDGKFHPQPPLKTSKTVEFEPPFGKLEVYYVPHPETLNLSKLVPGVRKVVTMGTWPPIEMELLKQLIGFGIYEKKTLRHKGQEFNTLEIVGDILYQLPRGQHTALWGYALHVEVKGKRNGKDVQHVLTTSHPYFEKWGDIRAYAKCVAIPLSIGTQLILKGKTRINKGYHCAYEVFYSDEFFRELKKRGIEVHERTWEYHKIS
jgi:saccharopine dehydrogenase-like NADP-dependent oxidoreductase